MRRRKYIILRDAFELAILYLPILAISELVETLYPFDTSVHYRLTAYILPAVSGLLCFFVLISENAKNALKKWALSVPVTLVFWFILYLTNFSVRLTNTMYPGYGRESAGGGFAFMVNFLLFSVIQGIANLLAIGLSRVTGNRLQKLRSIAQGIILPSICIIIFLVMLYLEFTMPTWKSIYQSVYS